MSVAVVSVLLIGILSLQIAIALAIVRTRNLFGATMMTGAFSLLGSSLFMVLDAADVAFTEAAVGAGISSALILSALSLVQFRDRERRPPRRGLALLCCGALLSFWISLIPHMPTLGDPQSPLQAHPLTVTYFDGAATEIGIPNTVTAVLGSYRAFDTLGEVYVIFIAGLGVFLLLGGARRERLESDPMIPAEDSDAHR